MDRSDGGVLGVLTMAAKVRDGRARSRKCILEMEERYLCGEDQLRGVLGD